MPGNLPVPPDPLRGQALTAPADPRAQLGVSHGATSLELCTQLADCAQPFPDHVVVVKSRPS